MAKEKKYPVMMVDPRKIAFNPGNVRGEDEATIEADEDFLRLKESVYDYGVLVPLVVIEQKKGDKEYLLIDGERRLRAALATNKTEVPVHVPPKEKVKDEILLSFQIHMLRKEWSRIAQARALLNIIKTEEGKLKDRKELFDIIKEKTGYDESKLKDLFRVLRYVKTNKNILDEIDYRTSRIRFSHLVQLEASFVEQIKRTFPEIIKEYGLKSIREKLLDKVRANVIGSTREPIDKLLPLFIHAQSPEQKNHLKKLIKDFLDNKNRTPEDVFRSFELKFPTAKEDLVRLTEEVTKKIEELDSLLNNLRTMQFGIYQDLKEKISDKVDLLINTLKKTKKKFK